MKKKYDNIWLGVVLSALTPVITIYLIITFVYPVEHLQTYYENIWIPIVAPKVISLGVVPNLALFFLFIYTNRLTSAKGVLATTIVYAVIVFILKLTL